MCGRYCVDFEEVSEALADELGLLADVADVMPLSGQADIRPSDAAPVLIRDAKRTALRQMKWGFEKPGGGLVINARSETLAQRPMFRDLMPRQRCAMPASRYYEWRKGDRQKFEIGIDDRNVFFLAGLYRIGPEGCTFVVITQPPVVAITPIHDRMPLLLDSPNALEDWLDGEMPLFSDEARLSIAASGPEQLQMQI